MYEYRCYYTCKYNLYLFGERDLMRIILFILANLGIMVMVSLIFSLFDLDQLFLNNGINLNLNALLIMSAVMGMAGSVISLFSSKWMAKRSMGVQLIVTPETENEYWLYHTVEKLAEMAQLDMPEVGYFNNSSPNAFATGWNKNAALVAVSTGLLDNMTQSEVEAVLAHEISHIANGDMVTLALVQGVVNTFVIFFAKIIGYFVDRVIFKNRRGFGVGYYISYMAAQMVLGIIASLITLWFSRWREYYADAGAAKLSGTANMIAALKRLQTGNSEPLADDMAAFGISGYVSGLFSTHPPLEDRIKALEEEKFL